MATVKICPTCNIENIPRAMFCQKCATSLAQVRITQTRAISENPVIVDSPSEEIKVLEASASSADLQTAPETMVCPECGYQNNPPEETLCLRCTTRLRNDKNILAIIWPWGSQSLKCDIRIGRDPNFSSLARQLDDYTNISRVHAEIIMVDQKYYVRDLKSSNGTFINDQQITPYEKIPLGEGTRIRFAADLQVSIQKDKADY